MRYELVVVWASGGQNVYAYFTEDECYRTLKNMKMALGNQIAWGGVRKAY